MRQFCTDFNILQNHIIPILILTTNFLGQQWTHKGSLNLPHMIIGRIDSYLTISFGGFRGNTFRTLSDLNDHNITVSTSNLIAKMQHDTS